MKAAIIARGRAETETVRTSVTIEKSKMELVEDIARQKKVPAAWVIRDAVDQYLENQWPLINPSE